MLVVAVEAETQESALAAEQGVLAGVALEVLVLE
jgi:hypothetical protein